MIFFTLNPRTTFIDATPCDLEAMLGNSYLQSTCSERICLKFDGQYVQNGEGSGVHPAGTKHHKATVTTCIAVTRPVRMACHGSFLKDKTSNDALFHQATPHVNLWHVPLMFDNFLTWLTTVISVHDAAQMQCCLVRQTYKV
jgi:hypothetical protein